MKRILIASPVRKPPRILAEHLRSLESLDTGGFDVGYIFLDDNDDRESSDLLLRFCASRPATVLKRNKPLGTYVCNERTHFWRSELILGVANAKNMFLKHALDHGYDGIFLVDADLVLHPKTLRHLASLEKDIVAEVFWTAWQPGTPCLPNTWLTDDYTLYEKHPDEALDEAAQRTRTRAFLNRMRDGGAHPVGGLGACTLVSAAALRRGVSFQPIRNLSLWGEDRWFCVRAAVLGLELWADTRFPPLHLYRDDDVHRVPRFWKRVEAGYDEQPKLTLSMLVRNEADRYLRDALLLHRQFIDEAVIIDDGSTDGTLDVVRECLADVPHHIHRSGDVSFQRDESAIRRLQWDLTLRHEPDWILNLDADEIFEDRAVRDFRALLLRRDVHVYGFPLFDMWSATHYRDDAQWTAHTRHFPMLTRYTPDFQYSWSASRLHCGRFPSNLAELSGAGSDLRIRHYGWARPEDRIAKHKRYTDIDPDCTFGDRAQMDSILDPAPILVPWRP